MRDFNELDFFIQKKRLKLIEQYVPPNATVLDLGCGFYPQNLINLNNKISRGVGIDRDIPAKAPSTKIQLIKADIIKSLPLPDSEFDCVLILAVLEHLDFPGEIIRECARVLKPGGRLIITIPSNYSRPRLLTLAMLGLISREEIFDHKHYFNKQAVETMLGNAGLKMVLSRWYNLRLNLLFVFEK